MSAADEEIPVEVAYALPDAQWVLPLQVRKGTTAGQAIMLANWPEDCPGIEGNPAIGIFGREVSPSHVLQAGDRVEVYRKLINDPKQLRRQRAKKARR